MRTFSSADPRRFARDCLLVESLQRCFGIIHENHDFLLAQIVKLAACDHRESSVFPLLVWRGSRHDVQNVMDMQPEYFPQAMRQTRLAELKHTRDASMAVESSGGITVVY